MDELFRKVLGGSIFDPSIYQNYLSHKKDCLVDGILRDSLLQAAEKVKERFSSLSSSPVDLLLQSYSVQGCPQNYDKASIDAAFDNATIAAMFELNKANHGKSSLQLMELLIGEASKFDSAAKMAIIEWIVLSCVPRPEISAGSAVVSFCLHRVILRAKSDYWVKLPVETIIAAIERLPADKEVKLLLQFVIVGMIETLGQRGCTHHIKDVIAIIPRKIGMTPPFKPAKSGSGKDEPQPQVEISPTLFRRFVYLFKRPK